ncbi:YbhN family protein [Sebaldella sp. S0638]|uniref:lysylphosphatidylglycerol synthase transmembrane domain-containing protein n=1 Tax=Sebaldella sp. S0638 TaxID=2957809 RepID=UPI00209CEF47|nr:YbhN family protein [Sebaldella sp. S0638]MCP1224816.1 hypothetical protein [Sebaldella sp. S0638]
MKKKIILILKLLFFILILFLLYKELKNYNIRHIIEVVNEYSMSVILLGLFIAGLNYFILTFYDLLALRNEDEKLPFRKVIPVSFTAFAFGNSLGFSGISSSAIRLRLYGALKIPEGKIIKISLFTMVSFWVGLVNGCCCFSICQHENICGSADSSASGLLLENTRYKKAEYKEKYSIKADYSGIYRLGCGRSCAVFVFT